MFDILDLIFMLKYDIRVYTTPVLKNYSATPPSAACFFNYPAIFSSPHTPVINTDRFLGFVPFNHAMHIFFSQIVPIQDPYRMAKFLERVLQRVTYSAMFVAMAMSYTVKSQSHAWMMPRGVAPHQNALLKVFFV